MAVSKRLRYEILRRDNHACRYCGATAPDVALTVDHVIPTALGGSDQPDNLVTACKDCNAGKSASSPDAPLVADVAQDAMRWGKAMLHAQVLASEQREERDYIAEMLHREFNDVWVMHYGEDPPDGFVRSLLQFYDAGAVLADLEDAAEQTARCERDDDWRYFCGVVWGILRKRQAVAAELIRTGAV